VALAVLLLLALGLAWQLNRPAALKPAAAPPPRLPASTPTTPGAFRFSFPEEELNARAGQLPAGPAQDVRVDLQPGLLIMTGTVALGPVKGVVRAELEPYVEQGRVAVRVREARLGGVPLPPGVRVALADRAAQLLSREQDRYPDLVLDRVEVTDTEILLVGHLKRHPGAAAAGGGAEKP